MELGDIQTIISKAFEQVKTDQIVPLLNWLDGEISKYRISGLVSTPIQSVLTPKINNGQRFLCTCGRSFSAEINIRETTNVETSSPPATPMLSLKTDLKYQQHSQEPISKRSRMLMIEPSTSLIPTTTITTLADRSTMITNWQTPNLKTYEDSPELMTVESNRGESDIELSSDESRCLEDIDAVLSPDKNGVSNFIYSSSLWPTSLSPSTNSCLPYQTHNHEDHRQHHHHHHQQQQQQMITLKPVSNEPLSPTPGLMHDGDSNKTVVAIHRRPMLVAFTDPEASSPTGPTQFKCTQCHETFDSLLLGQEHANNGMCSSDATVNVFENSDSHLSPTTTSLFEPLQDNLDEVLNTRVDSKAACPICNKVFSSVHTMIRHKTSIHDRQVRYGCNICGRFFFRKDKLTSHMVYHQDFDTYVCCFCSVGCKSRMLMRQHLKRDHVISGEDTCFNDILNRCQVKKSLNLETNMSVAYGNDRQITSLKRNLNAISAESDIKQTASN
jgi:transposase-like protein